MLLFGALLAVTRVPMNAPAAGPELRRPQAAALRNCSAVMPAEAPRFAFNADGAKLQWQADETQCLSTTAPHGVNATGVMLRDCASSIDWTRVAAPSGGIQCTPTKEVCADGSLCPASGVCRDTGLFFLSPSTNASLCLRAQVNFGAVLLIPCHADPWNTDPWHFTPVNDSRVYCPQHKGTLWTLTPSGQLRALMSNPFQVGSDPAVCSEFEGCLGFAAIPNGTIRPLRWKPVPLSAPLRPTPGGWMHQQLLAQANGFGGHEYPFSNSNPMMHDQNRYYPFANASGSVNNVENDIWLGGNFIASADLLLSETYPYWLNGYVPLVALLDNQPYIQALHQQTQFVLAQAASQGAWLGPLFEKSTPLTTARGRDDFWQTYRMLGALTQYAELAPSNAAAVASALLKIIDSLDSFLVIHPIVVGDWSHMRMTELLAPLLWLTDHAPASSDLAPVLSLMGKVSSQGMDWTSWILSPAFENLTTHDPGNLCGPVFYEQLMVHGVDVGTGLMQQAHQYRVTGDNTSFARARQQLDKMMALHGQASGVFSAGECICGKHPDAGTETCAVVETMESLGHLFTVTGDTFYLDQLEQVAFNALPAAFFNGSMGAMQYFQHVNTQFNNVNWTSGQGVDQLRFMQVFECCLANHNMGFPKYAQRAVMTAKEDWGLAGDTLAVLLYHDFEAKRIVLPSGGTAGVVVSTDYPFGDVVSINFTSAKSITVALRIPGWCANVTEAQNISEMCRVERQICTTSDGCRTRTDPCEPGGFFRTVVQTGKAIWPTAMKLHLPMRIRLENRTQNGIDHGSGIAVHRGPLLYSYAVPWSPHMETECNASGLFPQALLTPNFTCDITLNTTGPLPELNISHDTNFSFQKRVVAVPQPGQGVFATSLAPVELVVQNAASEFTLIPFGATDIRTTELPPRDVGPSR